MLILRTYFSELIVKHALNRPFWGPECTGIIVHNVKCSKQRMLPLINVAGINAPFN